MAAKLIILILSLSLIGSAVLVIRQQRLLVYAEMTHAMRDARALDRELLDERIRIARALHPERIEAHAARLGALKPLPSEWCPVFEPLGAESSPELRGPGGAVLDAAPGRLLRSDRVIGAGAGGELGWLGAGVGMGGGRLSLD
ncbi:MAG: hypothetical protein ACTS3F_04025 [Phycisphaerales bacterium]